jgi:hypothetical protein
VTEDTRSVWLAVAGLVAILATAAVTVGVAVRQEGGDSFWWWFLAAALLLVALGIGGFGLIRPWKQAGLYGSKMKASMSWPNGIPTTALFLGASCFLPRP